MKTVSLPHNYVPRSYQIPFLEAMDRGRKRACLVWHRRSGKTKTLLNFEVKKAFERVGTYYHCFPEYGQGRKIIWDGIDEQGRRLLDTHIPKILRRATNKTEMKIELVCGSIFQIIGADNYDSLVGPNPVGLVLDEWAVSERYKQAWQYFTPILAENKGWAVFPYTPRGRNHGWDLYQMAMTNPDWFCQLLTVEDTQAVSRDVIEGERLSGMSSDMIEQEFYCSFLASMHDILIPFNLIQDALRRDVSYSGAGRIAGLDVARFGNDRTAMVIRQGGQVIHAEGWKNKDVTQTVGKVMSLYKAKLFDCVAVDVIGLGAGVYDMLKNAEVPCIAVNVAESPSIDGRFWKMRDELWWKMREWFQEGICSISQGIPDGDRKALVADIQDIHYSYKKMNSLIVLETKDEMKERLGFSPDYGDALCCTFAPGVETKVKYIHRTPFGKMMEEKQQEYDPLHFGLGV